MKMIVHQTIGVNLDIKFRSGSRQRPYETLPVCTIKENRPFLYTSIEHMIKSPLKQYSSRSWHNPLPLGVRPL